MRAHIYVILLVSAIGCLASEVQKRVPMAVAPTRQEKCAVTVTAYCACKVCCGQWSSKRPVTAAGKVPKADHTVACNFVPFGTRIKISGRTYVAEDRTAKRYSNRIDIFMRSHEEAKKFGRQELVVTILTK